MCCVLWVFVCAWKHVDKCVFFPLLLLRKCSLCRVWYVCGSLCVYSVCNTACENYVQMWFCCQKRHASDTTFATTDFPKDLLPPGWTGQVTCCRHPELIPGFPLQSTWKSLSILFLHPIIDCTKLLPSALQMGQIYQVRILTASCLHCPFEQVWL